jgi:hypothetical protein
VCDRFRCPGSQRQRSSLRAMTVAVGRRILVEVSREHLCYYQKSCPAVAGDCSQRSADVAADERDPAGQLVGWDVESGINGGQ